MTDATDTFEYKVGKKTLTLPLLSGPHMTLGLARKTRGQSITDATFTAAEALLDDEGLALFDQIPQSEFAEFVKAWHEASGISLGESKASSNS